MSLGGHRSWKRNSLIFFPVLAIYVSTGSLSEKLSKRLCWRSVHNNVAFSSVNASSAFYNDKTKFTNSWIIHCLTRTGSWSQTVVRWLTFVQQIYCLVNITVWSLRKQKNEEVLLLHWRCWNLLRRQYFQVKMSIKLNHSGRTSFRRITCNIHLIFWTEIIMGWLKNRYNLMHFVVDIIFGVYLIVSLIACERMQEEEKESVWWKACVCA